MAPSQSQIASTHVETLNLPNPPHGRPQILVNESISEGMAILASAHAGVAWFLSSGDSERSAISFKPSDCLRLTPEKLAECRRTDPYLSLTESALNNIEVALVGGAGTDARPTFSRGRDQRDCNLRMYILVRGDVNLSEAMAASANAAIGCFARYAHQPEVQDWAHFSFRKVICRVTEVELQRAMKAESYVAVGNELSSSPVALAFSPRSEWPKMFRFLSLYR